MRVMYIESVGGASGDMLLGALVGAGLEWELFKEPLEAGVPGLAIRRSRERRHGLAVWRVWCEVEGSQPERHRAEVAAIVQSLGLPTSVVERSLKAFSRLACVEAEAHGCEPDDVHFHELGAVDSIMDVVGFFWALHLLGVEHVEASPLKLGFGTVKTQHGLLPVPVPAVAGLVENTPVEPGEIPGEATTPTGALLITETAARYGNLPSMNVDACGTGAGSRETAQLNVLRVWIGEREDEEKDKDEKEREQAAARPALDTVRLECNVDDMGGEHLGFLRERLEEAGVYDVTVLTGVGKKGRPVHLVQVLAPISARDRTIDTMFRHSTTLGIRLAHIERLCLPRQMVDVSVDGATIRVKEATWRGEVIRREPEYEDCAALCRTTGRSLVDVQEEARRRARVPEKR